MEVSQSDSPLATFNYYKLRGGDPRASQSAKQGQRQIGDLDKWSAENVAIRQKSLAHLAVSAWPI